MIRTLSILLLAGFVAYAEDGLFAFDESQKPKASVDGKELVMRMALKKLELPAAKRVLLFDSEGSSESRYTIQVDLVEAPEEGWMPMLVLGDDVILEVGISRSGLGSTLSFGTDDPDLASKYLRRIGATLGLSNGQVLDRRQKQVEPDAAPEPLPAAAVLESSETMNPKPESEAPADGGVR